MKNDITAALLRPVEAYLCLKLAGSRIQASNLVTVTTCTDCKYCAAMRQPWHRWGVMCAFPITGIGYWQYVCGVKYNSNDPKLIEAPKYIKAIFEKDEEAIFSDES